MEPRILIVEDDALIGAHLEALVTRTLDRDVILARSVAEAVDALMHPVDIALLDVEVGDGKTFGLAAVLATLGIPFVFMTAADVGIIPPRWHAAPLVRKPFEGSEVIDALRSHPAARDGTRNFPEARP